MNMSSISNTFKRVRMETFNLKVGWEVSSTFQEHLCFNLLLSINRYHLQLTVWATYQKFKMSGPMRQTVYLIPNSEHICTDTVADAQRRRRSNIRQPCWHGYKRHHTRVCQT
ncbi:mono [Platysternon megacephalum]|uniref:Mono n=1 Tax=Platysternon megacephalum TaxID=55544 RepID=A0A4D9F6N2_9SAUR|nr:mono [Platysternon megacephalum]